MTEERKFAILFAATILGCEEAYRSGPSPTGPWRVLPLMAHGWKTKQDSLFSPHSAYAIQYGGNVGA